MTFESQKQLREFWAKVEDNMTFTIKDLNKLSELFAKLDTAWERREKQLIASRDMWKCKWRELKDG